MRHLLTAICLGLVSVWSGGALAQDRTMVLLSDTALAESGLLKYLVPRFALKTGVRVTLVTAEGAALAEALTGADAVLAPEGLARDLQSGAAVDRVRAAFFTEDPADGGAYSVALVPREGQSEHARRFHDWLTSEIGQRTVVSFAPDGGLRYQPGAMQVAAPEIQLPEGDADMGETLAHFHCGRCHVISDRNRFGGIGSTPSFGALRAIPGWEAKFLNFWAANPHPSFTQVDGVTEPFGIDAPPHIAPVEITQEELAAIVAYAAKVPPKDLGQGVQSR